MVPFIGLALFLVVIFNFSLVVFQFCDSLLEGGDLGLQVLVVLDDGIVDALKNFVLLCLFPYFGLQLMLRLDFLFLLLLIQ